MSYLECQCGGQRDLTEEEKLRLELDEKNDLLLSVAAQAVYIEKTGCPCGARIESLNTHPHVAGCGIRRIVQWFDDLRKSVSPGGIA